MPPPEIVRESNRHHNPERRSDQTPTIPSASHFRTEEPKRGRVYPRIEARVGALMISRNTFEDILELVFGQWPIDVMDWVGIAPLRIGWTHWRLFHPPLAGSMIRGR